MMQTGEIQVVWGGHVNQSTAPTDADELCGGTVGCEKVFQGLTGHYQVECLVTKRKAVGVSLYQG